jgi:transposase-like protein
MARKRRRFSAEFKAKVALEAVRGQKTLAELADEHEVHANQITQWKKQLLDSLPTVFGRRREQDAADQEELTNRLYRRLTRLGHLTSNHGEHRLTRNGWIRTTACLWWRPWTLCSMRDLSLSVQRVQ